LTDADKCIELNPNFVKGYSRKGAAHYGLGQYEDAVDAYDEGLEREPGNEVCQQGKQDSEKRMSDGGINDQYNPYLSGEGNDNPMKKMFANAKNVVRNHPKLKQYENDPEFNGFFFFFLFTIFFFVII
jgi:stress-induced-phosphoprotein 1